MVVEESADCTALSFSSALAAEARLTTPTAAKPKVHLLNFIWFLRCYLLFVVLFGALHFRTKPVYPGTNTVHLLEQIGETTSFDNNFFWAGVFWCNLLGDNSVQQIPNASKPSSIVGKYV